MDENTILSQLEELANSLKIKVRYELLNKQGRFFAGGLCRLKGEYTLIINSRATTGDRIQTIAKAVARFDLSQVYLRPGLREFLDSLPE